MTNPISLITALAAILARHDNIHELPDATLIEALPTAGEKLDLEFDPNIWLMLRRLQTLHALEDHKLRRDQPGVYDCNAVAELLGEEPADAHGAVNDLKNDSRERMIMLRRLMLETVRAVHPAERNRLDVEYMVGKGEFPGDYVLMCCSSMVFVTEVC